MTDPEFIDPKYLVRGDIIAYQGEQRTIEESNPHRNLAWAFELVLDGGKPATIRRDESVRWFGREDLAPPHALPGTTSPGESDDPDEMLDAMIEESSTPTPPLQTQFRSSFEEAIAHVQEIKETQTGDTDRSDLISGFCFNLPEAHRDHLIELRQTEARGISCNSVLASQHGLLVDPDEAWEDLAKLGLVKIVSAALIDTDRIPENVNKRQVYFWPIGYEIAAYVL